MKKNKFLKATLKGVAFLIAVFSVLSVVRAETAHTFTIVFGTDEYMQWGQHKVTEKCSGCGYIKAVTHANHVMQAESSFNKDVYCKVNVCRDCKYKQNETHSFGEITNGSNPGMHYNLQICTKCGYKKKTNEVSHIWSETFVDKNSIQGYPYHYFRRYCLICNYSMIIGQAAHNYKSEILTTGASDTTHQVKNICEDCEYSFITSASHNTTTIYERTSSAGKHKKVIWCPDCRLDISSVVESCNTNDNLSTGIYGGYIEGEYYGGHYHYKGCSLCKRATTKPEFADTAVQYRQQGNDKHVEVYVCGELWPNKCSEMKDRLVSNHVWRNGKEDVCQLCGFHHKEHVNVKANMSPVAEDQCIKHVVGIDCTGKNGCGYSTIGISQLVNYEVCAKEHTFDSNWKCTGCSFNHNEYGLEKTNAGYLRSNRTLKSVNSSSHTHLYRCKDSRCNWSKEASFSHSYEKNLVNAAKTKKTDTSHIIYIKCDDSELGNGCTFEKEVRGDHTPIILCRPIADKNGTPDGYIHSVSTICSEKNCAMKLNEDDGKEAHSPKDKGKATDIDNHNNHNRTQYCTLCETEYTYPEAHSYIKHSTKKGKLICTVCSHEMDMPVTPTGITLKLKWNVDKNDTWHTIDDDTTIKREDDYKATVKIDTAMWRDNYGNTHEVGTSDGYTFKVEKIIGKQAVVFNNSSPITSSSGSKIITVAASLKRGDVIVMSKSFVINILEYHPTKNTHLSVVGKDVAKIMDADGKTLLTIPFGKLKLLDEDGLYGGEKTTEANDSGEITTKGYKKIMEYIKENKPSILNGQTIKIQTYSIVEYHDPSDNPISVRMNLRDDDDYEKALNINSRSYKSDNIESLIKNNRITSYSRATDTVIKLRYIVTDENGNILPQTATPKLLETITVNESSMKEIAFDFSKTDVYQELIKDYIYQKAEYIVNGNFVAETPNSTITSTITNTCVIWDNGKIVNDRLSAEDDNIIKFVFKSKDIVELDKQGRFKIMKTDGNGKALANAYFSVTDSNEKVVSVIQTQSDGIGYSGYLPLGTYTLTETQAPNGYILNTFSKKVTISKDRETVEVSFINQPEPTDEPVIESTPQPKPQGHIEVIKSDEDSNRLKGAVFNVLKGDVIVDTIVTNDKGFAKSRKLDLGEYVVVEQEAPEGYIKSDERHKVKIQEDGSIEGMILLNEKIKSTETPRPATPKPATPKPEVATPSPETPKPETPKPVDKPTFEDASVTIKGAWNHWRGIKDKNGKKKAINKHRFMSLEQITVTAKSKEADKVIIRMSPELEAMKYTDKNGNVYKYNDYFKKTVQFPEDTSIKMKSNEAVFKYGLPMAKSTLSWNDKRLHDSYYIKVTFVKGEYSKTIKIDDIELTGSIYDLIGVQ